MNYNEKLNMSGNSPYNGAITREQFLFYETRTVAKLRCEDLSATEIADRVVKDNLFQYPTEKSVRRMVLVCLRRLEALNDTTLIELIATQPSDVAKQICLYAMMKQYRLIWDFMLTVIGEKYKSMNTAFSKIDVNVFFIRLQEQDNLVATWTESTVTKLKQVILRILVENDYLDNTKADHINPVLLNKALENTIRANGDEAALTAFNCLN